MSNDIHQLLRPSLSATARVQARLFSFQSHALVAFFFGPLGFAIYCLLEARDAGLLKKHWLFYSLLFVASFVFMAAAQWLTLKNLWPDYVGLADKNSLLRQYGGTLFALVSCGIFYLRIKPYFMASALQGASPSPWRTVIYSLILTYALFLLTQFCLKRL